MPSLCLSEKFSLDPEVDATKGAEIHIRRLKRRQPQLADTVGTGGIGGCIEDLQKVQYHVEVC